MAVDLRGLTPTGLAGRGRISVRTHATTALLLAAPVAMLVLVVGVPLVVLGQESASGELGWGVYAEVWNSPATRTVLLRTLTTAALVSLVCLLLAYPYAFVMTVCGPLMRGVLLGLVLLPFWTSFTIRTLAWVVLLQDHGLVNDSLVAVGLGRLPLIRNTSGVVVGMTHVLLPYAVLSLYAVLRRIDRRLLDAAAICGARKPVAFAQVYLPLSMPGVAVATSLVFILSLGFFITPQLLGSPRNALLSQLIYTDVAQRGDTASAAALGMILLLATLGLLLVFAALARRPAFRAQGGVV